MNGLRIKNKYYKVIGQSAITGKVVTSSKLSENLARSMVKFLLLRSYVFVAMVQVIEVI